MRSQFALLIVASLHWSSCQKSSPSPGTVLEGKPAPATPERTSETAKPAPPLNEDRILKEEDLPELNEAALNSDAPKEAMKMGQAYAASDRPEDPGGVRKPGEEPRVQVAYRHGFLAFAQGFWLFA